MPIAPVNRIDLYYEIHGHGPRLVLIEGLGYHLWMWYWQIPVFAARFETLVYDNRGVGKSDKPPGPYTHEGNADDLAAVMDHIGWERAHVLGVSMGGFIAQEFALKYPQKLDRLVVVATGFGGKRMIPVPPEAVKAMMPDPNLSAEERMRRAMPIAFGDAAWPNEHPDQFDQMIAWRLEEPQPPEAAMAQIMAGATFDVSDRVQEIDAPTLVLAGSEDHVVPPENATLLAEAIPNARAEIIRDAGHLVFIEAAHEFNRHVISFLGEGVALPVEPAS